MNSNLSGVLPILGGVFATLVMTLFTLATFALLQRPYNLLRILGHMLLFKPYTVARQSPPRKALVVATFVHYAIGVLFAFAYQHFVNDQPKMETLLFAFVIASIGVAGWRLLFFLHPGPPSIDLQTYLLVIGIGHFAFTSCLYLAFYFFPAGCCP